MEFGGAVVTEEGEEKGGVLQPAQGHSWDSTDQDLPLTFAGLNVWGAVENGGSDREIYVILEA